tara:strand:- start:325 stop:516 length:192 start_codon:yes stop_codon:yes gene_type:complete
MFKNMLKNTSIIVLLILLSMTIYSCEDDVILEPQPEEECTGSYCNLSIPNSKQYIAFYNPKVF